MAALPVVYRDGNLRHSDGSSAPWPEFAVVGDPIAHSLSPRLHGAALAQHDLKEQYAAIQVAADQESTFWTTAFDHGVRGLNVTVPHKLAALRCATRASEEARSIGAANTLQRGEAGWTAHNTDARGLAMAIQRQVGRRVLDTTRRVVVLGGGGAARAVVVCMQSLGARELVVAVRDPARAQWAADAADRVLRLADAPLATATLVVNATPLGLRDDDASPVDGSLLSPEALVVDLVYGERPTALLQAASSRGCATQNGLPMLIAQAALAFALWWGCEPPLVSMGRSIGIDWAS